jgi:hypothetical protein
MPSLGEKRKARVAITTTAKMNRRVIGEDSEQEVVEVMHGRQGTDRHVANVRSQLAVTLSQNYCSVTVNAGIELPVAIEHPGDDVTARRGLRDLDEIVDKHVHKRMRQAQRLLDKLAERNR